MLELQYALLERFCFVFRKMLNVQNYILPTSNTNNNIDPYISMYILIPLTLGLIERDGGLSTMCHGCGFTYQQRVLKRFLALVISAISAPRMG